MPMPRQFASISVGPTPITLVTTAETAILTLTGLWITVALCLPAVFATASCTVGTGTNVITFRLYRGTTFAGMTPLLTDQNALAFATGNVIVLAFSFADSIVNGDSLAYTTTVQQGSATGNGTVTSANITAMIN